MRISLKYDVMVQAARRPYGYVEDFLAHGRPEDDGDTIDIPDEAYEMLKKKYRQAGPTVVELLADFATAMARWTKAGWPSVPEAEFQRRVGPLGCGGCQNWKPEGWGGLGSCALCGCLELKLWLPMEECPLPEGIRRWSKYPPKL